VPLSSEQVHQLRALKGAPISILFALLLSQSPLGRDQLVLVTGWGRDKVTEGLAVLQTLGLAAPLMRFNGWELTCRARQMNLFEGDKIALEDPSSTAVTHVLPVSSISSSSSRYEGDKIALANPEILHALREAGIGEPVATQLAIMPHVNKSYIMAHAMRAKADQISKGLLIHRHLDGCECHRCERLKYAVQGVEC
jgi:hypothetical protein